MKHTDVAKSDESVESVNEGITSDDLSDTGNSSKGEKRGGVAYSTCNVGMRCFVSLFNFFFSFSFLDQAL